MPDAVRVAASEVFGLRAELIYATPDQVWRHAIIAKPGTTIQDALAVSQFFEQHPDYPSTALAVGIYGRRCSADQVLVEGDRVEIYRPLVFDPMESRRRRAAHRQRKR